MAAAVDALVAAYGRLDIVFANAGINGVWAPVEEITPGGVGRGNHGGVTSFAAPAPDGASRRKIFSSQLRSGDINLKGSTFLTVKYSVPHLKRAGGSIAICSSVQGTRMFSVTGSSVYHAI